MNAFEFGWRMQKIAAGGVAQRGDPVPAGAPWGGEYGTVPYNHAKTMQILGMPASTKEQIGYNRMVYLQRNNRLTSQQFSDIANLYGGKQPPFSKPTAPPPRLPRPARPAGGAAPRPIGPTPPLPPPSLTAPSTPSGTI